MYNNPNTFAGLVGKVRKKLGKVLKNYLQKEEGREGGEKKKAHIVRPRGPGLKPGICRVLGEGPQLHTRGAV